MDSTSRKSLLIIGDSFVEGVGDIPSKGGWANRLAGSLSPQWSCQIHGIGGYNISDLIKCYKQEIAKCSPSTVVIEIGINDSRLRASLACRNEVELAQFEHGIKQLIQGFFASGVESVWVVGLSRVEEKFTTPYKPDKTYSNLEADRFDRSICAVTNSSGGRYIPISHLINSRYAPPTLADGLHPSPFGHELIHKEVLEALRFQETMRHG